MSTYSLQDLIGPLSDVEKKNAPNVIYSEGDISFLKLSIVSIIGSRKASTDGIKRAQKLARKLSERAVVILSGLAEGIDTAAHQAAIESGGRTIGVLGTPLDQFYPKQNKSLQEQMMKDHLVISRFPVGSKVSPKNFPIRNYLMALLSRATVIVEAEDKSGSLYQAWEAIRLKRPLYFLKSNLDRSDLSWPKELLSYGAKVLTESTMDELVVEIVSPNQEFALKIETSTQH